MRALIVEDERPAREELKRLLAHHPSIKICGEAANSTEALELCAREKPDLLFLDIEMPGKNGFAFLEEVPPPVPQVIFTTAYDVYAVKAFETNALDYLLKPINPKRLAKALERLTLEADTTETRVPQAVKTERQTLFPEDRVFVRDSDRCWFVPIHSIRLLESEGNHTKIHFDNENPLIYRTISSLEERLPRSTFMRANRSQIINLTHIETIGPWFSGSIKVVLRGGTEVEFSRRQAQLFREQMSL